MYIHVVFVSQLNLIQSNGFEDIVNRTRAILSRCFTRECGALMNWCGRGEKVGLTSFNSLLAVLMSKLSFIWYT